MNRNDAPVTKAQLDKTLDAFEKRLIDQVTEIISDFTVHIDRRFDALEKRMEAVELSVAVHEGTLSRHERWHYQAASNLNIELS